MTFQPGLRRFVVIPLIANVVLFSLMGWLLYEVITDFYDAAMLTVPSGYNFVLDHHATALVDWRADDGLRLDPARADADFTLSRLAGGEGRESMTESRAGIGGYRRGAPRGPASPVSGDPEVSLLRPDGAGGADTDHHSGVQRVRPAGLVFAGAWMMSLQFVDYPMDNHRLPFREVRDACAERDYRQLALAVRWPFSPASRS